MLEKLKRNKKGIETGLVDFYGTIVIALIIILFFFILHFRGEKISYGISGVTYNLDSTQIALLYAQTDIESSKGNMTFSEFIAFVAEDKGLEDELSTLTKEYLDNYCEDVLNNVISIKITLRQDDKEKEIMRYTACSMNSIYLKEVSDTVLLPLQKPGDFIQITIITLPNKNL